MTNLAPSGRGRMLALIALCELMAMSTWFTAAAVAPDLALEWGLDASQVGWLTGAVSAGFVVGTALSALLNVADLVPSGRLFAICALLGAIANAMLLAAPGYETALGLRFATGAFLAGVYPPAMKMIATWFASSRGLAIGTVVGALTLGKATPWLVRALPGTGSSAVILVASAAAVLAAVAVLALWRDGPHPFSRRPFSLGLVAEVVADRSTRLAIGGYLGHMWELYAMWTWTPAFVAASLAAQAAASASGGRYDASLPDWISFCGVAAGGAGCVWGGWQGDQGGRRKVVMVIMAGSALCACATPFVFGGPVAALVLLIGVWGFLVVADSPLFSAMVTQTAPSHAVGTALTLQTCLGFLLTVIPIQLIAALAESTGWRWVFPVLALGPVAGIACISRIRPGIMQR